jgi:(p)ppGpp synthase/HD superfamily hydrolase
MICPRELIMTKEMRFILLKLCDNFKKLVKVNNPRRRPIDSVRNWLAPQIYQYALLAIMMGNVEMKPKCF